MGGQVDRGIDGNCKIKGNYLKSTDAPEGFVHCAVLASTSKADVDECTSPIGDELVLL